MTGEKNEKLEEKSVGNNSNREEEKDNIKQWKIEEWNIL